MTQNEKLAALVAALQDDGQDWIAVPGQSCIRAVRELGRTGINVVAHLLSSAEENHVKLHCVMLLAEARMAEADDALADALDLPLVDEVREQILEDAADLKRLHRHARFSAKARALYERWPRPELKKFLEG